MTNVERFQVTIHHIPQLSIDEYLFCQISWVFDCKGAGLKNMDIDIINWNTEVDKD